MLRWWLRAEGSFLNSVQVDLTRPLTLTVLASALERGRRAIRDPLTLDNMDSEKATQTSATEAALPTYENNAAPPKRITRGIRATGESGRSGFHPLHFLKVTWRTSSIASKFCNFLWPTALAAIILRCKYYFVP